MKAQQQQEQEKQMPKGMSAGWRRGKDPRLVNLYVNSSGRRINVPFESINNCEWNIFPLKNILLGKYDKYFRLIWSKSIFFL